MLIFINRDRGVWHSPAPLGSAPSFCKGWLQIGAQIPQMALGRGHRPTHPPGCAPGSAGQWWPPACDTCPVSLCPPTSPPSSGAGGGASPLPEPRQGGFPARWAGNHTQHFEFLRKKRKFLKGGKTAVRGFAMEMQGCVPWGWWLLASPLSLLASPQRPLDWVPLGLAGQEQTPRRKQRNKGKQKRTI